MVCIDPGSTNEKRSSKSSNDSGTISTKESSRKAAKFVRCVQEQLIVVLETAITSQPDDFHVLSLASNHLQFACLAGLL